MCLGGWGAEGMGVGMWWGGVRGVFFWGAGAGMQVGGVGIERQKPPVDRQEEEEEEPGSENGWDAGLARLFMRPRAKGWGDGEVVG